MDFRSNEPIYLQIAQKIKAKIVSGEFKSEEKLPSIRELSYLLQVNPNTVSRSIQQLEREGVVETRRGVGSFVREGIQKDLKWEMAGRSAKRFLEEMERLALTKPEIEFLLWGGLDDGKAPRG